MYNEITLSRLEKYHPDETRDAEDFFENQENQDLANYNVEGYKYREFRNAIQIMREAGLDPNERKSGKRNCPIRRLSL